MSLEIFGNPQKSGTNEGGTCIDLRPGRPAPKQYTDVNFYLDDPTIVNAYVQGNTAHATSTSATITLPSTPTVNNWVIWVLSSVTATLSTPPTGYTLLSSNTSVSTYNTYVYARQVLSGDSATIAGTLSSSAAYTLMAIEVKGGLNTQVKCGNIATATSASHTTTGTSNLIIPAAGGTVFDFFSFGNTSFTPVTLVDTLTAKQATLPILQNISSTGMFCFGSVVEPYQSPPWSSNATYKALTSATAAVSVWVGPIVGVATYEEFFPQPSPRKYPRTVQTEQFEYPYSTVEANEPTSLQDVTRLLNPRAYYPLNEASGTTAFDDRGYSNGTYSGSTVTVGSSPITSGDSYAPVFSGTTGKVNTNISASDPLMSGTNFTISAWISPSSSGGGFGQIATNCNLIHSSSSVGWMLYYNWSSAKLFFEYSNGTSQYAANYPIQLQPGAIYHVVGAFSSTGGIYAFVNAQYSGFGYGGPGTAMSAGAYSPTIGLDPSTSDNPFLGTISEVALFPYTLSASQVKQLYLAGVQQTVPLYIDAERTKVIRPQTEPFYYAPPKQYFLSFTISERAYVDLPSAVAADSPVGYWRLNEDSGSTAYDSSGNGNNLAVGSSVTVGAQQITPGDPTSGSYQFPGGPASATTTASIGNTAILQPSGSVTLEALTYTSPSDTFINGSGNQTIAGQGSDASSGPYVINLIESSSGVCTIWTAANTNTGTCVFQSGAIYNAGTVYYVSLVYNQTTGVISQYLNGTFIGSTSGGGTITYDGNGFAIGADGAFADYTFSGQISDVSVYAGALSANRVAAHSQAALYGPTVQAAKNIQKTFTISEASTVSSSYSLGFPPAHFLEAQQNKATKRVLQNATTIFETSPNPALVPEIFNYDVWPHPKVRRPQTDYIFSGAQSAQNYSKSFSISESSSVSMTTDVTYPTPYFIDPIQTTKVVRPQTDNIFSGNVPPTNSIAVTISEASSVNVALDIIYSVPLFIDSGFPYPLIHRPQTETFFDYSASAPWIAYLNFTISESSSVSMTSNPTYPVPYFYDPVQKTRVTRPQTDNIFNGGVPSNTNLSFTISESSSVTLNSSLGFPPAHFLEATPSYPKRVIHYNTIFELPSNLVEIPPGDGDYYVYNQPVKVTRPQTDNIFNGNVPVSTSLTFTISESSSVNLTTQPQQYHAGSNFLTTETAKVKRTTAESIFYGGVPPNTNLSFTISESSSVSLTQTAQNYYAGANFLSAEIEKVKRPQTDQIFYGGVPPNTNLSFTISEASSVNVTASPTNYFGGANFLETAVSRVKRPQTDNIFNGNVPSNTVLSFTISESSSVNVSTQAHNYFGGAAFVETKDARVRRPQTEQIFYGGVPPNTVLVFTISEASSCNVTTTPQNYFAGAEFTYAETARIKRTTAEPVFYGGVPPNTNLSFTISEGSSVSLVTDATYPTPYFLDPIQTTRIIRPQTDNVFNGDVPPNTNLTFQINESSNVTVATDAIYSVPEFIDSGFPYPKIWRPQTDTFFEGSASSPWIAYENFSISESSSVSMTMNVTYPTPYFIDPIQTTRITRPQTDNIFNGDVPVSTSLSFTISESSSVNLTSSTQNYHAGANFLSTEIAKVKRPQTEQIWYGDVPPTTNLSFTISEGSSVSLTTNVQNYYAGASFLNTEVAKVKRPQVDQVFYGGVPPNTNLTFSISESSSVSLITGVNNYYAGANYLDTPVAKVKRPQTDNIFNGNVPFNTVLSFTISEGSSVTCNTSAQHYYAGASFTETEVAIVKRPQTDQVFYGGVPPNTNLSFTISESSSVAFSSSTQQLHAANYLEATPNKIGRTTADSIFYGGVPPNTNLTFSISEASSITLSTDATYPTPYYLDPIQTTRIVRPQTDNMFMGGVPSNTILTFTISESSSVVLTSDAQYPTPYFLDPIQQTRVARPQTDNIFNGDVPPNTSLSFTISEGSSVSATTDVIYSVPLFIDSGFPYPIIHRPQTETFLDYSASAPWIQYENFSISESSSVSMTFDVTYPVPYFIDPIQTTRVTRPQTDNIFPGDVPPNTNLTFTISESSSVSMTKGTLYPTPYFIDPIQQTRITRPQTDNIFSGNVPPTTNLTFTISEASSVTMTGLPQNFYPTAPIDTPPTKVKRTQAESIFSGGVPPNTNLSFTISEGSSVSLSTDSTFPTPYFVDPIQTTRIVRPQTDNIFNGGVPTSTSLTFTISESSSVSMTTDATYPTPYFLDPIQKTRITRPQTDNIFNGGVPSNTSLTFTISESSSVTVVTDDIWSAPQFVDSGFPYPNIHRPQTETFLDYSASAPWIAYESFTISEASSVVVTKNVTYPTPYFVDPIQQTRIIRPQTDNIFNGGVPSNTNLSFTISEGSSVQLTTDITYPTPYFLDPIQTTRVVRPQTDNIFNGNVPVSTALSFTISESSSVTCGSVATHVFPGAGTVEPQVTKKYSAQPETFFYGDVPPTTNLTFVINEGSYTTLTSSSIKVTIPFFLDPIQQTKIVRPQTDNIFNGNVPTNTSLTFTISEPSSVSMVSDAVFPTPYFIDPIQTTRIVRPQTDNIFNGDVPPNTIKSFTISEGSSVSVTTDATYPTPYFLDPVQKARIVRPQTDNIFNGGVPSNTSLTFTISESSSCVMSSDATYPTPYFLDPIQKTKIVRPQTDNIFNGGVPSNTNLTFTISEASSVNLTTDATFPTPYFYDPIQKTRVVRPQTDNMFMGGVPSNTSLSFTISESSSVNVKVDPIYSVPLQVDSGFPYPPIHRPQTDTFFSYSASSPWVQHETFTISEASSVTVQIDVIYSVPQFNDSGYPLPPVKRTKAESVFYNTKPTQATEVFSVSESSSVTLSKLVTKPESISESSSVTLSKQDIQSPISISESSTASINNGIIKSSYTYPASSSATGTYDAIKNSFSTSESSTITEAKNIIKAITIDASSSVTVGVSPEVFRNFSISEGSTTTETKTVNRSLNFSSSAASSTSLTLNKTTVVPVSISTGSTVSLLKQVIASKTITEGSTTGLTIAGRSQNVHLFSASYVEMHFEEQLLVHPPILVQGTYNSPTYTVMYWTIFPANTGTVFADRLVGGYPSLGPTSITLQMYQQNKTYGPIPLMLGPVFLKAVIVGYNRWKADGTIPSTSLFYDVNFNGVNCRVELVPDTQVAMFNSIYEALFTPPSLSFVSTILIHYPQAGLGGNFGFSPGVTQFNIEGP